MHLQGYNILTVQARFHQLRPTQCQGVSPDKQNQCEAATGGQEAVLFTGLYLLALGTSGVKAGLPSLGADHFDEKDPKEAAQLSSFFNWFLFSLTIGNIIGVTSIVWISTNQGWKWSFVICTTAVLCSIIFLSTGKSLYQNNVPEGSTILRFMQVFLAATRNRNLPIPDMTEELYEIHDKEIGKQDEILKRTDQFRNSSWNLAPSANRSRASPVSSLNGGCRNCETHWKSVATEHNMADSTKPLPMSVFWLGIQFSIFGAADLFTLMGLLEFIYAESSIGMKSISTPIAGCSSAFGYILRSFVVEIVNRVSGGWLANNNLNRVAHSKGKLELVAV
ncbi:hypothetical protein JCGZ_04333 [Jatropha curcas]|uniref:Uncharacterized protein n=1 Tax=Jatropha curcas TaxID=180498 RepID=A0A067KTV5_JATCU|nr:hypothetical protein JCGZ_04333 [Jatropha curcas]